MRNSSFDTLSPPLAYSTYPYFGGFLDFANSGSTSTFHLGIRHSSHPRSLVFETALKYRGH